MSFGNRSNFASLSDAYGIDSFSKQEEVSYKLQEEPKVIKENFTEQKEEIHCKGCSCHQKRLKPWIGEILNIILICMLLWVIIYSPYV